LNVRTIAGKTQTPYNTGVIVRSPNSYKTLNLLEIKRQSLMDNYSFFQKLNPKAKICPVLKGNAYGHGLKLTGKFVDQEIKPEFICVDSLYEAYELEKIGVETKILIMGYTFPENFRFRKINFHLPLFDLKTLRILNKTQPGINVHLKIDTGMNRLGIKEKEVEKFIRSLKKFNKVKVVGIYSHLADADNEDESFTKTQAVKFKETIKFFENSGFVFKWKHLYATAGAFGFHDEEFNLIRLGLGFYGISPFSKGTRQNQLLQKNLKPVLKLVTHICQIKQIEKGDTVSYGRTFKAKEKMKIAVLPLGYYDGLDRRLSNIGKVKIGSVYCPILGRVCMNVTVIDVSAVKRPYVGQEVVVYDSVKETSDLIKTIPYEVLANLSETTRRVLV